MAWVEVLFPRDPKNGSVLLTPHLAPEGPKQRPLYAEIGQTMRYVSMYVELLPSDELPRDTAKVMHRGVDRIRAERPDLRVPVDGEV